LRGKRRGGGGEVEKGTGRGAVGGYSEKRGSPEQAT